MTERCQKSSVTLLIESLQTTLSVLHELVNHVERLRNSTDKIDNLEARISDIENTIQVAYSLSTIQENVESPTLDTPPETQHSIVDINRGLFTSPVESPEIDNGLPQLIQKTSLTLRQTLREAEYQRKQSVSRQRKRKRT